MFCRKLYLQFLKLALDQHWSLYLTKVWWPMCLILGQKNITKWTKLYFDFERVFETLWSVFLCDSEVMVKIQGWIWNVSDCSQFLDLSCVTMSSQWGDSTHTSLEYLVSDAFLFSFEWLWSPLSVISVSSPMWYQ